MKTVTYPLLALILYSAAAAARGSYGSASDGKAMIVFALLFGIVAIGSFINKNYPGIPQLIGGILVCLMVGFFIAGAFSVIGIIDRSSVPMIGIALGVAAPFVIDWWSSNKIKKVDK